VVRCSEELAEALRDAGERERWPVCRGSMLTASHVITGADRRLWAERGFFGVDMETGLLSRPGNDVAALRVILDTPVRQISSRWDKPSAWLHPRTWADGASFALDAPRFADRAARLVAVALSS
ncbi:MAG: hypothetical protein ACRDFS_07850, partial [Chloroflexota bacterium]